MSVGAMASSDTSLDVDEVPMADIVHEPPSNGNEDVDTTEASERHPFTPNNAGEDMTNLDDPPVTVAIAAKHSKWGKLRQTVKATTIFASAVSDNNPTSASSVTTRSRRKLVSQADDRRDSFLKRFSTRQSSCGTPYLQPDATSTPISNLEPDGKVRTQQNCQINYSHKPESSLRQASYHMQTQLLINNGHSKAVPGKISSTRFGHYYWYVVLKTIL